MLVTRTSHITLDSTRHQGATAETTNHLTPQQLASAGMLLSPSGWGLCVGVIVEPEEAWPVPGRYGWAGGYGTVWFNDPHRGIIAMAMTQTSDFLWNGGADEFGKLVGAL
jgi:CubicO group peptidase (beta-lactamase class C family)